LIETTISTPSIFHFLVNLKSQKDEKEEFPFKLDFVQFGGKNWAWKLREVR
jgi:hypothetical protein